MARCRHDDEGQHDGVFDRGRPSSRLQKIDDEIGEALHGSVPFLENPCP